MSDLESVWQFDDAGNPTGHSFVKKESVKSANSISPCVSAKLKIVSDENPNMPKDQQLAIAYAYCQKEGMAQLAQDLKEKNNVKIIG